MNSRPTPLPREVVTINGAGPGSCPGGLMKLSCSTQRSGSNHSPVSGSLKPVRPRQTRSHSAQRSAVTLHCWQGRQPSPVWVEIISASAPATCTRASRSPNSVLMNRPSSTTSVPPSSGPEAGLRLSRIGVQTASGGANSSSSQELSMAQTPIRVPRSKLL